MFALRCEDFACEEADKPEGVLRSCMTRKLSANHVIYEDSQASRGGLGRFEPDALLFDNCRL
jgi:hypothetical protein